MPPAATRRTTAAKDKTHVDFDAARKKAAGKRKQIRGSLTAYGRNWDLKRPNIALVGELEAADTIASLTAYIVAHIVQDQREEFVAALKGDEDLDAEDVLELGDQITSAVYADIPT